MFIFRDDKKFTVNSSTKEKIEKTIEEFHDKAFKIYQIYQGQGGSAPYELWGIDTNDVINIEDGSEESVNSDNLDMIMGIDGIYATINSNVVL